ncbi:site-specific integrase [Sinomonas soli]
MGRRAMEPGERGEPFVTPKKDAAGLYRARCYYCTPDGVRREATAKSRTKGLARAAVEAKVDQALEAAQGPAVTVESVVWAWLDSRPDKNDDSNGISPQTRAGYAGHINRVIVPAVGDLPVADLTPGRVQRLLKGLVSGGRGYSTASSVLSILAPALRDAVTDGHIAANPAAECRAPVPSKKKPRVLTQAQLEVVHRAAREWQAGEVRGPARSGYLVDTLSVMLGSGVRIGEALALTWDDIDWELDLIHVRGTLVEQAGYTDSKHQRVAGRFFRQPWRKGRKDGPELIVEAPSWVMAVLARRHRERPALNPHNLCFVTARGTFVRPSNVRSHYRKAKALAGIDVELDWAVPHKLRGTALTAVADAVGLAEAAKQGGHGNMSVTRRYYVPQQAEPVRHAAALEGLAPGRTFL